MHLCLVWCTALSNMAPSRSRTLLNALNSHRYGATPAETTEANTDDAWRCVYGRLTVGEEHVPLMSIESYIIERLPVSSAIETGIACRLLAEHVEQWQICKCSSNNPLHSPSSYAPSELPSRWITGSLSIDNCSIPTEPSDWTSSLGGRPAMSTLTRGLCG